MGCSGPVGPVDRRQPGLSVRQCALPRPNPPTPAATGDGNSAGGEFSNPFCLLTRDATRGFQRGSVDGCADGPLGICCGVTHGEEE